MAGLGGGGAIRNCFGFGDMAWARNPYPLLPGSSHAKPQISSVFQDPNGFLAGVGTLHSAKENMRQMRLTE